MALVETSVDARVQTARLMRDSATGCYHQMRATFDNMERLVFESPFELSIQDAFTALGTDAGTIISFATQLRTVINTYAAEADKVQHHTPPGVTVTINPDGTVTVT